MVLKSEGGVAENQGDVLGVYRMVDSYCERPVYKQDGGENYIYYSSASSSWLVGTVVGHEHAWLRNDSEGAPSTRCLKTHTTESYQKRHNLLTQVGARPPSWLGVPASGAQLLRPSQLVHIAGWHLQD